MLSSFLLRLPVLLMVFFHVTFSQSIVKTLPGYNGTLPFKLETGYVGVGDNDEVQLFYYFIESERDPAKDPLVLWLTGGPGCSAFSGLVIEKIGPISFNVEDFNGSLPSFILNQYSWTKVASIIFLDSPVGTGFSYSTTSRGYYSSDSKTGHETHIFLRKWLLNHPSFIKNRLYIAGDSYGGKMSPIIVTEVDKGNEAGLRPHLNIQGYAIGNPITYMPDIVNERVPYANRMGLISDKYLKLAESNCNGEYNSPDPSNAQCLNALQLIDMCLENIFQNNILEPKCHTIIPQREANIPVDILLLPSQRNASWCREYGYLPVYIWANDPAVREALHVREGSKGYWMRCNETLAYEQDIESAFPYHQYLSKKASYEALVYSGDHDYTAPYTATLKWVHELNLTLDYDWRPWYVNGQLAGDTEKYKQNGSYLTFATVKGAGHTAPEYKPEECFAMIDRWLSAHTL